jgi:glyoxylase-like metal-dependent hydrolase (beta-lactamase superfamily II)
MTTPEEILPGVYGMSLGIVNAFVLVDEDVTLIDTGIPRSLDNIRSALATIDRGPVRNIALTHHHPDHRGSAAALAKGATIYVHPADATVVDGTRKPPGPAVGGPQKLLLLALGPIVRRVAGGDPEATAVDHEIVEGDEIPGTSGLRAIHTPGHTAGHVSYLHPDKRILFVGDAAQHRKGLALPPPFFTEDMERARKTLGKIAELDFDTAVFGHGTVLRGKANAEFRKLVDSLAR